jgi:hypothetical protein
MGATTVEIATNHVSAVVERTDRGDAVAAAGGSANEIEFPSGSGTFTWPRIVLGGWLTEVGFGEASSKSVLMSGGGAF